MKIGFDLSQTAYRGGVSVYTQKLAEHLVKIMDLKLVFFYSSLRIPYPGKFTHVKSFPIPVSLTELLFNRLRIFNIEKFIGKIDLFHSSDWTQPPTRAKKVTTYHDLIPLKFPNWSNSKIVAVHKRRLKIVEKEVDMVIAVSNATKADLLEVSNIPASKIQVIYEGVGEQFKPQDVGKIQEFKKSLKLPDNFVLAIGGVGNRKNLDRIKQASKDYNLVISGVDTPFLDDNQMPLLYASAEVLLYPSLYEGFGLPILEAFKCGTPVITSNVSSMPEIGGEAAIYVDPVSVSDIHKKLREVYEDTGLRQEKVKKGFIQSQKFSWNKCALETVDVYRSLVSS